MKRLNFQGILAASPTAEKAAGQSETKDLFRRELRELPGTNAVI
jgi:hypothetical protein